MTLLLDQELDAGDEKSLRSHLGQCSQCRDIYNKERWFLNCLHRARPLHRASDALRKKIIQTINEHGPTSFPNSLPVVESHAKSETQQQDSERSREQKRGWSRSGLAASVAVVALLIIGVNGILTGAMVLKPLSVSDSKPMEFATMAAETHRRHLLGLLPLEVETESPNQISKWFDGKVPFAIQLPDYHPSAGVDEVYSIKGARLVGFEQDYAAYVAYTMEQRPLGLVVTSRSVAEASGGVELTSRNLVFHYDNIAGYKVISWSHRGLTYGLVTDLKERAQQSCMVCHIGDDEQEFAAKITL